MEGDLNYVTATFERTGAPAYGKDEESVVIYEQVNVGCGTTEGPVGGSAGAGPRPLTRLLAAALGILCLVLTSVVITLSARFSAVTSEREGEIKKLTAEILLLERKTEELSREKERLNWTVGVILQYDLFPVSVLCPRKVCQPCQDGWKRFKSSCYLFEQSTYSYHWRTWEGSRTKCRELQADLVVIDSPEEQEFIASNLKEYNDDVHGYWVGLSNNNANSSWTWIDGSNGTVEYWKSQNPGYKVSCVLTLPKEDALTSWSKASCNMKNRWICEKKALIKFD